MKENMPGTHGWVDRGPSRRWPHLPAAHPDIQETIRQGKHRPRLLSPEERRTAQRNRELAREQAALFEQWAVSECGAQSYSGRIPLHSEYVPEEA